MYIREALRFRFLGFFWIGGFLRRGFYGVMKFFLTEVFNGFFEHLYILRLSVVHCNAIYSYFLSAEHEFKYQKKNLILFQCP